MQPCVWQVGAFQDVGGLLERVAHGEVFRRATHILRCEMEARVAGDAGPAGEVEPGLQVVGRDAGQALRCVAEGGHVTGEQDVAQAQHPHVHQRLLDVPHIFALLPVRILQSAVRHHQFNNVLSRSFKDFNDI